MRWQAKAALQNILSVVPRGMDLNYVIQRRVFGSLPFDDHHRRMRLGEAARHVDMLQRYAPSIELSEARFVEFGAGWDLTVPLAYYALGVDHQRVLDIRPNAKVELINDAISRLGDHRDVLAVQRLPQPITELAELARYGIEYVAPGDARATGLPEGSIDFVSSTFTLEHIPAADITAILRECARILRPGGLVSSTNDTLDHYSFGDRSVSPYNYLRYSPRTWALINSGIHYQNRLRAPDYEQIVREAGFEIVHAEGDEPTPEAVAAVSEVPLAPRFRAYTPEQLATADVLLVAAKPS